MVFSSSLGGNRDTCTAEPCTRGHVAYICSLAPFPTALVCSFPAIRPIGGQLTLTQSSLPVLWHCKQNLQACFRAQRDSIGYNATQNNSLVKCYISKHLNKTTQTSFDADWIKIRTQVFRLMPEEVHKVHNHKNDPHLPSFLQHLAPNNSPSLVTH